MLSDSKRIEKWKNKYRGMRCFCVGNGPSLNQTPLHLLEGEYSFGLNKIADIYPSTTWRPSFYVNVSRQAVDPTFALPAGKAIQETPSFLDKNFAHLIVGESDMPDNVFLLNVAPVARVPKRVLWSQDIAEIISKYGTTMLSVLQIAVYMGFDPIYLVGCDGEWKPHKYGEEDLNHFSPEYGKFHHFGKIKEFTPRQRDSAIIRIRKAHEIAKDVCDKLGVKIYNATIGGDLEVYPRVDLLELLRDRNRPMTFAAEIGSNHKGELAIACEMIRQAALAGADIAKFQFRDPDDPIRGLAMRNSRQLAGWCKHYGIEFMASIFSLEALEVARKLGMPRLKIAHSVAKDDPVLCDAIADGPEEVFVSHGDYDFANWRRIFVVPRYPTYPNELVIPEGFGHKWHGYSSHVHGYADALIAIARGARYIEKHVTLDKTETSIKDNAFSLSFDEFAQMVSMGREMAKHG